jgi:hypothetical protein
MSGFRVPVHALLDAGAGNSSPASPPQTNESAATPSATAGGWLASAPTSYTFATAGAKTLYAWAKDAAGNVSASRSASVTITLADVTSPPQDEGHAGHAHDGRRQQGLCDEGRVHEVQFMKFHEALFDRMDRNHDGKISKSDWMGPRAQLGSPRP